jgi:hypothetical protein
MHIDDIEAENYARQSKTYVEDADRLIAKLPEDAQAKARKADKRRTGSDRFKTVEDSYWRLNAVRRHSSGTALKVWEETKVNAQTGADLMKLLHDLSENLRKLGEHLR